MVMLISHPHKNLYCHLYNTYKIGNYIFKQKRLSFKAFSAEVIEEIVKISLLSHDLGKAMLYFQEYMYDIESNKVRNLVAKYLIKMDVHGYNGQYSLQVPTGLCTTG